MRYHPDHGWIYSREEVKAAGTGFLALMRLRQTTKDRNAIAHLDFEPDGEAEPE